MALNLKLSVGDTHQLTVAYQDNKGNSITPLTATVTYSSSDSKVATVDSTGLITAVAMGDCIISAVNTPFVAHANVHVDYAASKVKMVLS